MIAVLGTPGPSAVHLLASRFLHINERQKQSPESTHSNRHDQNARLGIVIDEY